ncbi:MAG: MBL fold metallo-hydrolase [Chloroflexi bacterium]|nr:MBL fold metallo-hydrolase [Chloroflexota bacterium]
MMFVHPLSCGLGIAFLIETPHGLFLIDSGSPGHQDRVLAKMRELARMDLRLIWITHAHYDHYGSADALRKLTGARIGVHPADAGSMLTGQSPLGSPHRYGFIYPLAQPVANRIRSLPATPPDFTGDDGETLEHYGLDAVILHTPGHTPGHSCLQLEEGINFAGDLIAGFPQPALQSLLATDWGQLTNSLSKLQAAQPKWIYTGHSVHPLPGKSLEGIKLES